VLWRLLHRTLRRCLTQEELWNGNRERLLEQFCSRQSLLLWVLQTHRGRRKRFAAQLKQPEYRHLTVVRLRSPGAAKDWLATTSAAVGTKEQA